MLFIGDDLSDVTILVGDTKFHLHKIILAARNDYFKALLFGGLSEADSNTIKMGDVTPEAFQKIVQFLYCARIDVHRIDKDLGNVFIFENGIDIIVFRQPAATS